MPSHRLALILSLFACPGTALPQGRFEDFATDPNWSVLGSGNNGNSFGYQTSAFAGGLPGEGGGRFTRTMAFRYYGDTDLDGSLSLNDPLLASGRLDWTGFNFPDLGPGLNVGHFRTVGSAQLGLILNTDTVGIIQWGAKISFDDGFVVESVRTSIGTSNVDRTWSYTWDPAGGTFGGGLLTVNLSGPGGGTHIIDLNSGDRARGATLDSFGLAALEAASNNNPSFFVDLFIDDVTYSAVPEPASVTLVGAGLALAARYGWRRRRHLRRQK